MRGLTAPCAPSLVSYVPAQLERVRATTRRLVGGMRTARAHAAMWSAGARTHARELLEGQKEKSEMRRSLPSRGGTRLYAVPRRPGRAAGAGAGEVQDISDFDMILTL